MSSREYEQKPIDRKAADDPQPASDGSGQQRLEMARQQRALQRKAEREGGSDGRMHAKADRGLAGASESLPHLDKIQKSFGAHDVSNVKAATGGEAAQASKSMNALAFASGDRVGFKDAPDLHTAAHEAAHVVQQRGGVQLKSGVGQSGDKYEKNADAVADAVVRGESAEAMLDEHAGAGGENAAVQHKSVQLLGEELGAPLPEGAESPGHGAHNLDTGEEEDKDERGETDQRRYTVEQYIAMWEEERGKKMTPQEQETLARGCIGITALNLEAVNPPLDNAYDTFEQAMAVVRDWNQFIQEHAGEKTESGVIIGSLKAVMFAKLFWSNQKDDDPNKSEDENREDRAKPDKEAFKPDKDTGKVDMTGYKYKGQPNLEEGGEFVNFDYGFWDEESQCFWHANHCQPDMKVYQSTKEKFTKGYIDFDRIIFCAAIAKNYNPNLAAENNG